MRQLNFVVSGPKVRQFFSPSVRGAVFDSRFPLVDIAILSRDIRDQILKSEIAPNFRCFSPPKVVPIFSCLLARGTSRGKVS